VPGTFGKTDKLDAAGLATLEHLGSLPTVWIAPGEIRDERELPRTRMAFAKLRVAIKNRVHSTLAKYALSLEGASDLFAPKWKGRLLQPVRRLPEETQRCFQQELEVFDALKVQIDRLEERIREHTQLTPSMQLLKSLPGVGVNEPGTSWPSSSIVSWAPCIAFRPTCISPATRG
jgi:transposase